MSNGAFGRVAQSTSRGSQWERFYRALQEHARGRVAKLRDSISDSPRPFDTIGEALAT